MMGELASDQNNLFYNFCLEQQVPANHLLRQISQALDLGNLRQHLRPCYSHTGRPSIYPELMIRMLIVGYCYGIRSERGLCEEVHLNLAYRWFCGLGLEDVVPDHSTFSKNRQGFTHFLRTHLKRSIIAVGKTRHGIDRIAFNNFTNGKLTQN